MKLTHEEMTENERIAFDGITMMQRLASNVSKNAGWYNDPMSGEPIERNFGEVVALMHSELSEALEADRKGLKDEKLPYRDGREVEFADCVIRIMDTCETMGFDLAGAIIEKSRFNANRADHKLENRAKSGGKKY